MQYLHSTYSLDEHGNPIIAEEEKKLYAIADTVLQILRESNICIGEALELLAHCEQKLRKYIVKSPVFSKHYNTSKNLAQPLVKTRDTFFTGTDARCLCESAEEAEPFEKLYPGYEFAEAEPLLNEVNGGYYLLVRMVRKQQKPAGRRR